MRATTLKFRWLANELNPSKSHKNEAMPHKIHMIDNNVSGQVDNQRIKESVQ
jgi:hypothetical protein